jgi:cystathionine beta-lyase
MRGLALGDDRIKDLLLDDAGVWLDEGARFGRGGEGFQRINLACPRQMLSDALQRIAVTFGDRARR